MEVLLHIFLFLNCCFFLCGKAIDIDCGNKTVQTIIVDQDGKGDFRTIQDAIDSIKEPNNQWVEIYIHAAIYKEKVRISINKPCLVLVGSENTIVTSSGGSENHTQQLSDATFISYPPNIIVVGITFENSFNLVGSQPISAAIAAAIFGDKSVFYKCSFLSVQDTLYDKNGRHYFKDCYIQGEVDFIYGSGQSYYEACTINATQGRSYPGFVTAQSRNSENDTSGFVFRSGSVVGTGRVHLGRAWGPYSRVIFYGTYLSNVVYPDGWNAWKYTGQESKFTYAEVNCSGPGANSKERVKWETKLNSSELNEFSLTSFINKDGWLSYLPIKIS